MHWLRRYVLMKPGATKPTAVFKRADEYGPGSKRNI
jgi:hypothetical protein